MWPLKKKAMRKKKANWGLFWGNMVDWNKTESTSPIVLKLRTIIIFRWTSGRQPFFEWVTSVLCKHLSTVENFSNPPQNCLIFFRNKMSMWIYFPPSFFLPCEYNIDIEHRVLSPMMNCIFYQLSNLINSFVLYFLSTPLSNLYL